MGKENFKKVFIATDMDGTFLGKDNALVERNLEAIKYFISNGGLFTVASGRAKREIQVLFPEYAEYINIPAVASNGSYLYDFNKNEFICEQYLDFDVAKNVYKTVCDKFPDIALRVSYSDGIVCPVLTPYLQYNFGATQVLVTSSDFDYLKDFRIHKMVFVAEEDKIIKLRKFMKENFADVNFTFSSKFLVEVLPDNASKGKKFLKLKEIIGNERKSICVGDYINDLEMLMNCDIPASPENACQEVKDITKIHLCSNINGCIADLIYKIENEMF